MDAHTWLFTNLIGAGGPGPLLASWLLIAAGLVTLFMFFKPALGLSRKIDSINSWIGHSIAWMILVAVLVSAANAIVRKVFNTSSNSWLEIQWILFGAVFLLCAPWTLMANEHIRIDIVNSLLPKRVRDWIDVIGHWFFIVPICLVMLYTGSRSSCARGAERAVDQRRRPAGLPGQVPGAAGLRAASGQGFSELIKRRAIMQGKLADTTSGGGHHAAAEAEAERLVKALAEEAEALANAKAAAARSAKS